MKHPSRGATVALVLTLSAPPATRADPAHYPEFSWDRVPVYVHFGARRGLTDEEVTFLAEKTNFITLEKMHGVEPHGSTEAGIAADARRLRAANPRMRVLFYWNGFLDYAGYDAHAVYESRPDWWLRTAGGAIDRHPRGLRRYDLSNPEVRRWWVEVARQAVLDGPTDGVFIDALPQVVAPSNRRLWGDTRYDAIQDGLRALLRETRAALGPQELMLYNGIRHLPGQTGGEEFLPLADAAIIEHFGVLQSAGPAEMAADLAAVTCAGKAGKIVILKTWPGFLWLDDWVAQAPAEKLEALARERLTFPLACFLVAAQRHAYFAYSWGYREIHGSLLNYPEFQRPLGEPLGDAEVNGFRYTRQFRHCRVTVDLETQEASLDWREP